MKESHQAALITAALSWAVNSLITEPYQLRIFVFPGSFGAPCGLAVHHHPRPQTHPRGVTSLNHDTSPPATSSRSLAMSAGYYSLVTCWPPSRKPLSGHRRSPIAIHEIHSPSKKSLHPQHLFASFSGGYVFNLSCGQCNALLQS